MDILIKDWTTTIIISFTTLLFVIYLFVKYKFSHWKRRGFHYIPGKFPFGSLGEFITLKKSIAEVFAEMYKSTKGHKYAGYYSFISPAVLIRDTELIKNIFVKDFEYFCDRGMFYDEHQDPLSAHLFAITGNKWKKTRSKLTPTFTSVKIKFMYETIKICAIQFKDYINELIGENQKELNLKYFSARHGVNVIANTAIGIQGHSVKDESDLSEIAFKVTDPNWKQAFRFILPMINKDISNLLRLRFTPKEVENYYLRLTKSILEYRTKNNIVRNDFMHLMMEMWDKNTDCDISSDDENGLSIRDVAAQTFLFILASYESSSSLLCFGLYELAMNPDIQENLLKEIDSAGIDISYETLKELKLLDMFINEILRKYPPGGFLFRECQRNYKMDDGKIIEKGTTVLISVLGLHHDPEYFPDPEKFDPERFNKSNPSHQIKPFTFIPFGEGPRFCMGKRFGLIQAKVTFFFLLSQFQFKISEKTQIPPQLDPKTFVLNPQKDMNLLVINRKK